MRFNPKKARTLLIAMRFLCFECLGMRKDEPVIDMKCRKCRDLNKL
jgi:hypothetical protein